MCDVLMNVTENLRLLYIKRNVDVEEGSKHMDLMCVCLLFSTLCWWKNKENAGVVTYMHDDGYQQSLKIIVAE